MRRRQFIAALGGAAAWPSGVRAQQPATVRRIGMLINLAEGDAEAKRRIAAFLKTLGELGWSEGKNIHVDYRWGVDCAKCPGKCCPIGGAGARRDRSQCAAKRRRAPAIDAYGAGGLCGGHRSGRARCCREPGAAGRQSHRLFSSRARYGRQMAGTVGRDRSGSEAAWQCLPIRAIPERPDKWPPFRPRRSR